MLNSKISNCFRIVLIILFTTPVFAYAQEQAVVIPLKKIKIHGLVLDNFGRPLPNVKITIQESAINIYSDKSGLFKIDGSLKSKLKLEHPKFYAKIITIKADSLTIRMEDRFLQQSDNLDVLYGTVNKKSFLGAASTVYSNELTTTPSTLYPYALTGRLPGLFTKQNSGFNSAPTSSNSTVNTFVGNIPVSGLTPPNDNTEIALRLRGLNPVTLIDGIQRDIFSIDPENIESISVLKDALSTVLLGQRSAMGILLITTKKPRTGKPRLSFTAQTALQQPIGLPTPLPAYQYAYLYNEARQNDGGQPLYSSADFKAYRDGSDPYGHPDVNWYNTVLENYSPLSKYNLNINGGGSTAQYSVSLNYTDQQGMFKESDQVNYNTNAALQRYLLNTSINVNINKNFTVGMQLFGRLQSGNQPGVGINNVLSTLRSIPNNSNPVYNSDGSWGGTNAFQKNLLSQVLNSGYIQDDMRDVMANVDLKYNLNDWIKGLSASAKTNIAVQSANSITRRRQDVSYKMNVNSLGETSFTKLGDPEAQTNNFTPIFNSRFWFGQVAVNYDRNFGKHTISTSVIADQRTTIYNFDLPGIANNLSGKAVYNYANKYFAEGIVNTSGYNRYRPGDQYGLFYAAGIGWDLAEENFIKNNVSWLNQFKLRTTYGKTGNGIDNSTYYNYRSTFSVDNGFGGSIYPQGTTRSGLSGFNENNTLANTNSTWEKANKFSAGVDVSAFNNHLQFVVDYYRNKYYDLLQTRGKNLAIMGLNFPNENIGKKLFTGTEFSATYQNNINKFNYFVSGNISIENVKTLFFDEQASRYPWMARTGLNPATPFGYISEGFFQSVEEIQNHATITGYKAVPGDLKYKDLNNDGVIDQFDVAPLLKLKPQMYYGLTLGFNYNGFEFSSLIQGVKNTVLANADPGFSFVLFSNGQAYEPLLGRWTPETAQTATYPRLTNTYDLVNGTNNTVTSSFWLRSSAFMRLKNVNLAYNLPYKLVNRLGLSGVKVFVNGENLLTWAEDKRYNPDPEVSTSSYPIQRVYNFGFNIKL